MSLHVPDPTPSSYQRRIANRHSISEFLTWYPKRVSRFQRKTRPLTATTVDMSVSGIGFDSDTCRNVTRGTMIRITIGEVECDAAVQIVKPAEHPGRSYYGVEYRDQRMIEVIGGLITAHQDRQRNDTQPVESPLESLKPDRPSFDEWY